MARIKTVPTRMSLTGYARSRSLVEESDSHTVRRPKAHAVEVRAMATITPSNHTRHRVEVPRAAPLQKDLMPPIAKGTAVRKPASASDGYGVTLNPTSLIDHTTSPAAHRPVEMLISAQPRASLPCARLTAQAQAADAIAAATASPMSSIAVTARSPNQPLRRISA